MKSPTAVHVFSLCFVCSVLDTGVESARILAIFPAPLPSHYFLGNAFVKGLAEKGHDVTIVSPYRNKEPPQNGTYREIFLAGMVEKSAEVQKDINFFTRSQDHRLLFHLLFSVLSLPMMSTLGEMALRNEDVQRLLASDETFDAVIVQQFMNEAQKGIAAHFKAPLILFGTTGFSCTTDSFVGNPSPLSYVPEIIVEPAGPRMTFWERATNTAVYLYVNALNRLVVFPAQDRLMKRYVKDVPDLEELQRDVSLVLLNGHISLNQATPRVPNMVDIGGFHVKPPKKLPKDLQEFLDGSPEGVVYLSFGSNLKSSDLPVEKREAFLKTFAKLKLKVLWKWENDTLPGQPANVKLGKWLPQQDLLAHPNVKLFITHGGFLSTTETVYHGVPVLAIPVYADQEKNSKMAVWGGFGLSLPFAELTEETLGKALDELLGDPRYTENAKARSRLFHDRPMTPMETGIYWVEYVIRHRGAPHLRVAGLDLPWYQYYLLDVAALFICAGLVLLIVNLLIARAVLRAVLRRLCRPRIASIEQSEEKWKSE